MFRQGTGSLIKQVRRFSAQNPPPGPQLIRVGDYLPKCDLYEDFPSNSVHMPDFVKGKNVIMFGVPGAFSPGCSKTHVPEYVRASNQMKKNGIDEIICVSVNDPYVMGAWADHQKTRKKIRMLADPSGKFIYSLGLGMHIPSFGGFRARRFAMVVVDSMVKELHIEPDGVGLCCTLAHVLSYKKYIENKNTIL
ncbi:hypothetical protein PYW07_017044 [Mythimna separata]|uniref:Peroxiredoxin-5 n=1 Tax=Mythimna separata TaxID=271217 RepID=A0AAD7YVN1_MYTSE|nr:hypothetical protein PYW07_017044 [Mythimna separata]